MATPRLGSLAHFSFDHRSLTVEGKFQLEINREKTRVVDLREEGASLDFLGYTFDMTAI